MNLRASMLAIGLTICAHAALAGDPAGPTDPAPTAKDWAAVAALPTTGAATLQSQSLTIAGPGTTSPFSATLEASNQVATVDLGNGDQVQVGMLADQNTNAISAGAVKTASARAVKDLTTMLDATREMAPLRHVTEAGEVGDAAAFLASDLSRGITGNVLFVDSGMHLL